MITKPYNLQCTNLQNGSIHLTWDEGEYPAELYKIYVSINNGAYTKISTIIAGVKEYTDTREDLDLKYKIRGVLGRFSKPLRGKNNYTNYTIEPMVDPNGDSLHIEFQRDNIIFASKTGYLMWSTDKGYNFTYVAFEDSNIITYSYIFSNGNVLFATNKNELWLGKNSLTTITQKYLKNSNGSNFEYHTPVNPLYPGIYFNTLCINEPTYQEELEMLVFGNYSMYSMVQQNGATPSLVYYSVDCGETLKVAYKFGQQTGGWLNNLDNGTATGGLTGTPMGDPTNPITCVHIHFVTFDPYTNEWFIFTGEGGSILKGTYTINTDTWSWTRILNERNKMYRCCGMIVTPTHYILLSDNTLDPPNMGVWKFLKAELTDYTRGVKIHDVDQALAPGLIYENTIIAAHFNNGMHATVSIDGGTTWNDYYSLPIYLPATDRKVLRVIGYPNGDGNFFVTPYNWEIELPYGKQSYLIRFK